MFLSQKGASITEVFPDAQGFHLCGGDQRAMKTDEVCDRPLETFGAFSPMLLEFYRKLFFSWSNTRKKYGSVTNAIANRGQGAIAPCRVQGQRPCWGLGQRPNRFAGDQFQGSAQQRRRQRSVPASNFALPQERPQAALFNIYAVSRQMGATDHPRCLRPSDNHHPCSQISKC